MTPFRLKAVAVLAVVAGLAGLLMGARSQPAAARTTPGSASSGWRVVYQSTSRTSNQLYSVAAVSPADAWAVGATAGSGGSADRPLVLHWNGTSWKPVAVPGLSGYYLPAVAASSASDVWLFAASANGGSPKAVRWNGSAWLKTPALPLAHSYYPPDVVAGGKKNVWVSGWSATRAGQPGRLMHWNGSRWQIIDAAHDLLTESPLATDGASGAWMGPYAHWTGTRWVNTEPFSPVTCSMADLTRIPGTATLWGTGGVLRSADRSDSVICAYPKAP